MAKVTDALGRPHSGVLPYVVIGIVIENVDPEKLGRVRVKFPTLHGEPSSFWLRLVAPHAGPDQGLYAVPEIDTEVLVAFLQGSHDVGVVLGQLWNGKDKPPPEAEGASMELWTGTVSKAKATEGSKDLDSNDRRLWRSRSGHVLVFDDTSGAESIQLRDRTGDLVLLFDTATKTVFLQSGSGDLHLRAAQDIYIEAGRDILYESGKNLKGKSGGDTQHESAMKIEMKSGLDTSVTATGKLQLESKMSVDVKGLNTTVEGSVKLALKGGAQAELQAGAMAKITAGVVMIN